MVGARGAALLVVAGLVGCREHRVVVTADAVDAGASVDAKFPAPSLSGTSIVTHAVHGDGSMDPALELAGFYLAHAVWCIADGETLIPLIGWERGGDRKIVRMKEADFRDGATAGRRWLDDNPEHVDRAVLIVDGTAPIAGKKRDALLATVVEYRRTQRTMEVVLPYRHARSKEGFAVNRPKVVVEIEADGRSASGSLWAGVADHEKGAAIWAAHLDESE